MLIFSRLDKRPTLEWNDRAIPYLLFAYSQQASKDDVLANIPITIKVLWVSLSRFSEYLGVQVYWAMVSMHNLFIVFNVQWVMY